MEKQTSAKTNLVGGRKNDCYKTMSESKIEGIDSFAVSGKCGEIQYVKR